MKATLQFFLVLCACAIACAPARPIVIAPTTLRGTDGAPHDVGRQSSVGITVIEFFSTHCPCQRAHDQRLRELFAMYGSRGVEFVLVDSEVGASPERDRMEALGRGYPLPILLDPGAKLPRGLR